MPTKIAVTGAAGFIGSNLCRFLLGEGYEVVGLDNLSAGTIENLPQGIEFKKVDIREKNLSQYLQGVSTVFHMAAKNCLADCAENPVEAAEVNVAGTANVFKAAIEAKVTHFIYSDTSAEYEGVLEFPSKVDQVKPLSIYACSKRGGALAIESMSAYYGLKASVVRYFNVYGPAQDWRRVIPPIMSAFTIKLLKGERPFIYGSGEKRRDFIHVDDVNRFHLKLLKEPELQGGTYNLGSGQDHSILEIFDLIESKIATGIKPEFRPELPGEAFRTLSDITETQKSGWRPQVNLSEGIDQFIQYTKQRLQSE